MPTTAPTLDPTPAAVDVAALDTSAVERRARGRDALSVSLDLDDGSDPVVLGWLVRLEGERFAAVMNIDAAPGDVPDEIRAGGCHGIGEAWSRARRALEAGTVADEYAVGDVVSLSRGMAVCWKWLHGRG